MQEYIRRPVSTVSVSQQPKQSPPSQSSKCVYQFTNVFTEFGYPWACGIVAHLGSLLLLSVFFKQYCFNQVVRMSLLKHEPFISLLLANTVHSEYNQMDRHRTQASGLSYILSFWSALTLSPPPQTQCSFLSFFLISARQQVSSHLRLCTCLSLLFYSCSYYNETCLSPYLALESPQEQYSPSFLFLYSSLQHLLVSTLLYIFLIYFFLVPNYTMNSMTARICFLISLL